MNAVPHVCHFTSVHPAGDTRIFVKECRSLAASGYRVSLVAANAVSKTTDGVEVTGVPIGSGRLSRMFSGAKRVFNAARELDADVYHFHDPELLRFAGRLRRAGKVVIYDSHEDLPRQIASKHYIPSFLKSLAASIAEYLENRWVKQCTAVVAATAYIRDRFLRFHPLAIDVCNYPSLEELTLPATNAPKELLACYVGSITEARGIREKITMMDGASFRLVLGGPFGPPELLEEMKQLPGWKNVEYLGPLSRAQVVEALGRCSIGLVSMRNSPNYAEALPVKMFEYMAAGIPVVTNAIPLWKKIVEESECGIAVDTTDTDSFRHAVEELLNDPIRLQRFGANGRRAVEDSFNWTSEERKLLNLYHQLMPMS